MKAVRVLLSPQEHLRKIILSSYRAASSLDAQTAGFLDVQDAGSSDTQTLFQQLLKTAVRPSPIKPIFGREELEVSCCSHVPENYQFRFSLEFCYRNYFTDFLEKFLNS